MKRSHDHPMTCTTRTARIEQGTSLRRVAWTTALLGAALVVGLGTRAEARSSHEPLSSVAARLAVEGGVASSSPGRHVRGGRRHGSVRVVHYRPYRSIHFGFGYPWWGWGPYSYGWGWGPYAYPRAVDYYGGDSGAIDLDIKPEEAEVYLDGERIGIADNYDGFPRYLWLEKGTYHLVLYKEGYETLAKRIELSPGGVLRLQDEMVPGVAKSPEELYAQLRAEEPTGARPVEERPLAPWRYRDRDEAAERVEPARPERSERADEDWRRRRSRTDEVPSSTDLRSAGGRLELTVTPGDTAVYVDGQFVGTAAELVGQNQTIRLDAGRHTVQLSRPGYVGVEREVTVEEGETTRLELTLDPQ